jgi:hypothetical protein
MIHLKSKSDYITSQLYKVEQYMQYYNRHMSFSPVNHILLDMILVKKQDPTLLMTWSGDQPKYDKRDRVCGMYGGEHKYTLGSSEKT